VGTGRFHTWSGITPAPGALAVALLLIPAMPLRAEVDPPVGPAYTGPRCVVTVGDFRVALQDAPPEIGAGLRQMLRTALFESNWFLVADRDAGGGVPAGKLLGDAFLDDPEALLRESASVTPAAVLVTGALVALEGDGMGLRLKLPGAPVRVGGSVSEARATMLLQATDTASGRIIATQTVKGAASSFAGRVGAAVGNAELPVELQAVRNTPLELAFRDCIHRGVIGLIRSLPRDRFRVQQ